MTTENRKTQSMVRVFAPILLIALMIAPQLQQRFAGQDAADRAELAAETAAPAFEYWYFPAQYVNQASALDSHIDTF